MDGDQRSSERQELELLLACPSKSKEPVSRALIYFSIVGLNVLVINQFKMMLSCVLIHQPLAIFVDIMSFFER